MEHQHAVFCQFKPKSHHSYTNIRVIQVRDGYYELNAWNLQDINSFINLLRTS
jgi:hypothetical protein